MLATCMIGTANSAPSSRVTMGGFTYPSTSEQVAALDYSTQPRPPPPPPSAPQSATPIPQTYCGWKQ